MIFKAVFHDETNGWTTVSTSSLRVFTEQMAVRGHRLCGENHNPAHRAELQGQPKFTGLSGPMFDGQHLGESVIRYESHGAYKLLSS